MGLAFPDGKDLQQIGNSFVPLPICEGVEGQDDQDESSHMQVCRMPCSSLFIPRFGCLWILVLARPCIGNLGNALCDTPASRGAKETHGCRFHIPMAGMVVTSTWE